MDVQCRVPEIVATFGGQSELGRRLDIRQSVVGGWVARGIIPTRRIPQIIAAAARLDPPVHLRPDDFFDLPPSPAAPAEERVG